MQLKQQKTGYYVTDADGNNVHVTDPADPNQRWHTWFSKDIARQIAREIGGWYDRGSQNTIKEVVVAL